MRSQHLLTLLLFLFAPFAQPCLATSHAVNELIVDDFISISRSGESLIIADLKNETPFIKLKNFDPNTMKIQLVHTFKKKFRMVSMPITLATKLNTLQFDIFENSALDEHSIRKGGTHVVSQKIGSEIEELYQPESIQKTEDKSLLIKEDFEISYDHETYILKEISDPSRHERAYLYLSVTPNNSTYGEIWQRNGHGDSSL